MCWAKCWTRWCSPRGLAGWRPPSTRRSPIWTTLTSSSPPMCWRRQWSRFRTNTKRQRCIICKHRCMYNLKPRWRECCQSWLSPMKMSPRFAKTLSRIWNLWWTIWKCKSTRGKEKIPRPLWRCLYWIFSEIKHIFLSVERAREDRVPEGSQGWRGEEERCHRFALVPAQGGESEETSPKLIFDRILINQRDPCINNTAPASEWTELSTCWTVWWLEYYHHALCKGTIKLSLGYKCKLIEIHTDNIQHFCRYFKIFCCWNRN